MVINKKKIYSTIQSMNENNGSSQGEERKKKKQCMRKMTVVYSRETAIMIMIGREERMRKE